jgi:hypothetical protein
MATAQYRDRGDREMPKKKIFQIRQSTDERRIRPDGVTEYDPDNYYATDEGWEEINRNALVALGDPDYPPEAWWVPNLYASRKGKTAIDDWDYYTAINFDAFSPRAIAVLEPFFADRFGILPTKIEGHDYSCLYCRSRIDCLDHSASDIVYFDDGDILEVNKYVFGAHVPKDPAIFAMPKLTFSLYCTASVPKLVKDAGLKGFDFRHVADAP